MKGESHEKRADTPFLASFPWNESIALRGYEPSHAEILLQALMPRWHAQARDAGISLRLLVLLPTQKDLNHWDHQLAGLRSEGDEGEFPFALWRFPDLNHWGNERFADTHGARAERIRTLASLCDETPGLTVLITTPAALAMKTLPKELFRSLSLTCRVGEEYDLDELIQRLKDLGYAQNDMVDQESCFAVRGGIVDVFPANTQLPVRLEFFGDTLSSIRRFAVDGQRSQTEQSTVVIHGAYEADLRQSLRAEQMQKLYDHLLTLPIDRYDRDGLVTSFEEGYFGSSIGQFLPLFRDEDVSVASYLGQNVLVFCPYGLDKCEQAHAAHMADVRDAYDKDRETKRPTIDPSRHFIEDAQLFATLAAWPSYDFGNPYEGASRVLSNEARSFPALQALTSLGPKSRASDSYEIWADFIKESADNHDYAIVILCQSLPQREKILNLLELRRINAVWVHDLPEAIAKGSAQPGALLMSLGYSSQRAWFESPKLLMVPSHELIGEKTRFHRQKGRQLKNLLSSFRELSVGDAVVHKEHGVGRYLGIKTLGLAGVETDFLILEYAGGDKLYMPVDKLGMLHKYSGAKGETKTAVDKLQGKDWERRTSKVKKAVKDLTDELLAAEAKRRLAPSLALSPANELFYRFEADFPYEETEDQVKAIEQVNADLLRSLPMDRLVCGDVGFGKTEVALRATMRAVLDGYQVMVLVPTTVLSFQHFKTFVHRFEKYGVTVGQLNRFVKGKLEKETISLFNSGRLDIVVGTHRILSADLKPKRLGLVIVDEEQRFGVTQKERIKALKAGCHILTLTATPIPRTLHLAMVGMRDISVINTPPVERLSVKTYIIDFDEDLVRKAILHEIQRDGQVFFVHNRVEDIEEVANRIRRLVPQAKVAVGHGQLEESQLEKIIIDFLDKKNNVLVCTTIIESGIDMSNVNTLIVNNADHFGLSQLYQLRGRVGRSSRQSYAYFVAPPRRSVNDEARKRLEVLAAHQELGAGFKIANYDLELRGAGSLLGDAQSGHIGDVGFDLYSQMLEEAIASQRGQSLVSAVEPEIKIPVRAKLDETYMPQEAVRLQIYKSLFSAESIHEVQDLRAEVIDRFGALPLDARAIFEVATLKVLLKESCVQQLSYRGQGVFELRFAALREQQVGYLYELQKKDPRSFVLTKDLRLLLQSFLEQADDKNLSPEMIYSLCQKLEELAQRFRKERHEKVPTT